MVQLIPNVLAPEVKSDAERRLFIEFRDHVTSNNYIILHSLGIAEHTNNIFGEIDFVILCHEGVLCLEVKGGIISRVNGEWEFTNRYGKRTRKNEGPFQQVQGNMQSLLQYMQRRVGQYDPLVRCQYACAVAMPDCYFNETGVDIIPEILVDAKKSWDLDYLVSQAFTYWRKTCYEIHGFEGNRLTDDEMSRLAKLLRGDFQFVPSMKDSVDRTVTELLSLTEEQYEILESLSENPKTLVAGVAGSGKTLIALEQAKRAFWEGKKVLYLCYNCSIAQYVSYQFEKECVDVAAVTLHAFMMRICGIEGGNGFDTLFYEIELPQEFLHQKIPEYDLLIIDEGQDLLCENYFNCLNALIKGGFQEGYWSIYYDPNQNIFNSQGQLSNILATLRDRAHAMSWTLRTNCRNTKEIVNANILLTNIANQGRPKVSGPQVQYVSYASKLDEGVKINTIIRSLRESGFIGSDFIILSKYSLENSRNGLRQIELDKVLGTIKTTGQLWKAKKNEIRFSTVSAFKGLETKIVIMIDVDRLMDDDVRLLNYVAVSRACAMLYVLYDQQVEQERQNMILSGFTLL